MVIIFAVSAVYCLAFSRVCVGTRPEERETRRGGRRERESGAKRRRYQKQYRAMNDVLVYQVYTWRTTAVPRMINRANRVLPLAHDPHVAFVFQLRGVTGATVSLLAPDVFECSQPIALAQRDSSSSHSTTLQKVSV